MKQAKEFGAFVVSYDWLEDSLQSGRKLAERKYTWEVLRDRRRNKKEMLRKGPLVDSTNHCPLPLPFLGVGITMSEYH